jgi:hypothetical protein
MGYSNKLYEQTIPSTPFERRELREELDFFVFVQSKVGVMPSCSFRTTKDKDNPTKGQDHSFHPIQKAP